MRCVIAEPSLSMRRIFRNALHRLGCHETLEVDDGQKALDGCAPTTSLLITSWSAEGIDGIALSKRLRASPETADIPILVVTVHNAKTHVVEARDAGVSDYMLKPFLPEHLRARLARLLRIPTSSTGESHPGADDDVAPDSIGPSSSEVMSTSPVLDEAKETPPADEAKAA